MVYRAPRRRSILIFLAFATAAAGCAVVGSRRAGWREQSFSAPEDGLSCKGRQYVAWNERYQKYVGVTTCDSPDELRFYMSEGEDGPFLPVTDTAGHGQDNCELVNPSFTLPDSDDIRSGGCATCDTGRNLPLEFRDTWTRSDVGEPFTRARSGEWSYQTSRIRCGVAFGPAGPE